LKKSRQTKNEFWRWNWNWIWLRFFRNTRTLFKKAGTKFLFWARRGTNIYKHIISSKN